MRTAVTFMLAVVLCFPLTVHAIEVGGKQWGTWTRENSPYNVIGPVWIPSESTLVIEPGVVVNFKGHYKFMVDSLAKLLAVGTETDSIRFTSDYSNGWHGIRLYFADSSSQICWCHLEHGRAGATIPDDENGGAIFCYYSNPIISNNTITHNWAKSRGGGIYCSHSSPTISNNMISYNEAKSHGAAIYCQGESNPTISGNVIYENDASGWSGSGAISCTGSSSPVITDNIIYRNLALVDGGGIVCRDHSAPRIHSNWISQNWAQRGRGGGINCSGSSPVISGNVIRSNSSNSTVGRGGGVYCYMCGVEMIITDNVISGNSAGSMGGAILCFESHPTISGNTIWGNSARVSGGGICCYNNSNPTVTSTILWGNTAPSGGEIYVESGDPLVSYCDVEGGWEGVGNIDAEPMFVGPEREDFHLRWHSPCIDAGVPDSLDPDGTRSDIGAFYFDQAVLGIVELYPQDTPIVIPPEGGDIIYDGWIFNFRGHVTRADVWTYVFAPRTGRYGPIDLYTNIRIPADSLGRNQIFQHVPGVARKGNYVLAAYVGDYPTSITDSSCFYFRKSGSIGDGVSDWSGDQRWFKEMASTTDGVPTSYLLSQNYPNPFNASTMINYQLPHDAHVKLEVYNLMGEKVATLVDSRQQPGCRSVAWNASEVSSGLYFYRLTAGDFTETKRMMLLK